MAPDSCGSGRGGPWASSVVVAFNVRHTWIHAATGLPRCSHCPVQQCGAQPNMFHRVFRTYAAHTQTTTHTHAHTHLPTLEAKQALSEESQEAPLPPPVSPLSSPLPLSMEVAVMRMSTLQGCRVEARRSSMGSRRVQ